MMKSWLGFGDLIFKVTTGLKTAKFKSKSACLHISHELVGRFQPDLHWDMMKSWFVFGGLDLFFSSWDYGTFCLPQTHSSNRHAQPSSGARCLVFGRTLRLLPYFMWANSEGSGEPAQMRRLAWAFAGRLCDKYHNLMSWLKSFLRPFSPQHWFKSVVRLTDRLGMTIDVDWDVKPQNKQTIFQGQGGT